MSFQKSSGIKKFPRVISKSKAWLCIYGIFPPTRMHFSQFNQQHINGILCNICH